MFNTQTRSAAAVVVVMTVTPEVTALLLSEAREIAAEAAAIRAEMEAETQREIADARYFDSIARPDYCDTFGADRAAYVNGLREMFGAAREMGLPADGAAREPMIAAIAEFLNDARIVSRKQLTPLEVARVANAIRGHVWDANWERLPEPAAPTTRHTADDAALEAHLLSFLNR